jgi:hypothetical protein
LRPGRVLRGSAYVGIQRKADRPATRDARALPAPVPRDGDASGLGVVVSSIRGTHVHLTDLDSVVLVELDLPSGQIEVRTSPARIERLAGGGGGDDTGYLVGLRITKINESLLPRFEQYLYALG